MSGQSTGSVVQSLYGPMTLTRNDDGTLLFYLDNFRIVIKQVKLNKRLEYKAVVSRVVTGYDQHVMSAHAELLSDVIIEVWLYIFKIIQNYEDRQKHYNSGK